MIDSSDSFQRLTTNGLRWTVHESFLDSFPTLLTVSQKKLCPPPGSHLLKHKQDRCSFIVEQAWNGHRAIFVKIHEPRGATAVIKNLLRPSKALTEWRNTLALRTLNLPTATPLAVGTPRRWSPLRSSILVMEAIWPLISLGTYMSERARDAQTRPLMNTLAHQVAQMHNAGFYHRDLHGGNIVCKIPDNGPVQIYLVDLHEGFWLGRIPRRWAVRDLARLNSTLVMSVAKRVRFLKHYLHTRRLSSRSTQRRWATEIENYTRALWRRSRNRHGIDNQKYGAPL